MAVTLGTMNPPDKQLWHFVMLLIVAVLCLTSTICGPLVIVLLLIGP